MGSKQSEFYGKFKDQRAKVKAKAEEFKKQENERIEFKLREDEKE